MAEDIQTEFRDAVERGGQTAAEHEKFVARGRQIVEKAPQLFIDVDVEGDGPAGYGSLLSIGAVAPDRSTFYVELRPQTETYLEGPHRFCEEHGLEREKLQKTGMIIEEAGQKFAEWVIVLSKEADKPPVFVAFNAGYDWAHCDLAIARAGIEKNPFGVAPFDTKSLAMALGLVDEDRAGQWDWSETSKVKLPGTLSPTREFTHNALEDAIWQQEQHFAMVGMLNPDEDSPMTLGGAATNLGLHET